MISFTNIYSVYWYKHIFIGITDIYKQNNSNCTIGFRNKQMLFLNLFRIVSIGSVYTRLILKFCIFINSNKFCHILNSNISYLYCLFNITIDLQV